MRYTAGCLFLLAATMAPWDSIQAQQATFQTETRLVEVQVVVRSKSGPVKGLTKDDFNIFDCKDADRDSRDLLNLNTTCKGKRQAIRVFHSADEVETPAPATVVLPPGTFSNRANNAKAAVPASATVVLLDQLNTSFADKGWERMQVVKLLENLQPGEQIAIYSLGQKLHVLEDFTDDPKALIASVTKMDQGLDLLQGVQGARTMIDDITMDAISRIAQHLAGAPGRKNLIWLKGSPNPLQDPNRSKNLLEFLREANIALYPVVVNTLKNIPMTKGRPVSMGNTLEIQKRARDIGASTGGTGYGDAGYIIDAVHRAEEDSASAYTLGFYPATADLDGKMHLLSVTLSKKLPSGTEIQFRKQYLATKQAMFNGGFVVTLSEALDSPIEATGLGLTAKINGDRVDFTLDVNGIPFEHKGDKWLGTLILAERRETSAASGEIESGKVAMRNIPLSFTDADLQKARKDGFKFQEPISTPSGWLHVGVEELETGATGSLRVALERQ